MSSRTITFPGTPFPPVELKDGDRLADHLDKHNSPILFGCRDGACAHCLVYITRTDDGVLDSPGELEDETLSVFAPDHPTARLACRLRATCNITLSIEK